MAATPVTATTPSLLTSSSTIASTDILIANVSGTTKKITAGNLRTQMFAFGGADPLSIGALTAVGNSTITGTLGGITALTVTPNGIAVTGNSTITGTLAGLTGLTVTGATTLTGAVGGVTTLTAATALILGATPATAGIIRIPNNTSLLARNAANNADITVIQLINTDIVRLANSQMTVNPSTGAVVVGGTVTASGGYVGVNLQSGALSFTPVAAQIVGGATSLSLRNNANNADNVLVSDAGNITVRGTATLTGGIAGTLTLTTASSKIVPGATSLVFRNNADSANNLSINDAGLIATRGGFSITAAGLVGFVQGSTAGASFNVPAGVAPTSPVDGDFWYDGTNVKFRVGITTKTFTLT